MKKTLIISLISFLVFSSSSFAQSQRISAIPATSITGTLPVEHGGTDQTWDTRPIRIIAHRGFAKLFPENTMYAFKYAIAQLRQGDLLETDIQVTSDGAAVLFHDETLDAVTDCTGTVVSHTLAEIQACNIDASPDGASLAGIPAGDLKIPLFSDLVTLAAQTRITIFPELNHVRTLSDINTIMQIAIDAGIEDFTIWQCTSYAACTQVRSKDPEASFYYFGSETTLAGMQGEIDTIAAYGGKKGYFNVSGNWRNNPTAVAYAYSKGVDVAAYTTNNMAEVVQVTALGITNVCSNVPYNPATIGGGTLLRLQNYPQVNVAGFLGSADAVIIAQNLSTNGTSGFVSKDNGGTKVLTAGVNGTAGGSSTYGANGEAILRANSAATGLGLFSLSSTGRVRIMTGSSATERFRVDAAGNVGIGTTSPTSILQVVGIPVYANNAAAVAGGLTVGAFYRTGGDPDAVSVVH